MQMNSLLIISIFGILSKAVQRQQQICKFGSASMQPACSLQQSERDACRNRSRADRADDDDDETSSKRKLRNAEKLAK
jgi:hypothetical protein